MMSAGSVIILAVGSLLPTGELAMAGVASLFVAAAVLDCGALWGLAVYVVSAALTFLFASHNIATWYYAAFFGIYPVAKLFLERKLRRPVVWVAKWLAFCASGSVLWFFAPGIRDRLPEQWYWHAWLAALLTVIFIVFDVGYSKLIKFYRARLSRSGKNGNRR